MRFTTTDQNRWGVIKEWLEGHDVQAPDHTFGCFEIFVLLTA
ncbi:MAG: hypothetical protein AB3N23_16875 [Paracoccaceae bacterium]